jgi:hypothetical protein
MEDYYRRIPFDAAQARDEVEILQRAGVFEKTIEELTALLERRTAARRGTKSRSEATAHNGGTPINDCPYETCIVDEQELLPLLNQGWDIVRELASGKIVIRRPNHFDE